jgi:hypothetical protein
MKASDYQTIADIIRTLPHAFGLRNRVAEHFAERLGNQSQRFRKTLFLKECGHNPEDEE